VAAVRETIANPMTIAVLTRTAIDEPAYVMERLIDNAPRIAAGRKTRLK